MSVEGEPVDDISSFCVVMRPSQELIDASDRSSKIELVGKRLFFINDDSGSAEKDDNEHFLKAHLEHLQDRRVLRVEGAAGSGKTTLVEEIAMLYISEAEDKCGYAIITNGCQTLTEQRLFTYRHNGVLYHGPLEKMRKAAIDKPDRRFVFILHEWNRVTEFMSLLGNCFEDELRSYGPDSWFRDDREKHRFGFSDNDERRILPDNIKIILTGNPSQDEYSGETADFLADGALARNRLLGTEVEFTDGKHYSLSRDLVKEEEQAAEIGRLASDGGLVGDLGDKLRRNEFPCSIIVDNVLKRLGPSQEHLEEITKKMNELIVERINPGKIVAEVRRYIRANPQLLVEMSDQLEAESQDSPTLSENLWEKLHQFIDEENWSEAKALLRERNEDLWHDYQAPLADSKTTLILAIEKCMISNEFEEVARELIDGMKSKYSEDISAIANLKNNQPFTSLTRAIYGLHDSIGIAILGAQYKFPLKQVSSIYYRGCLEFLEGRPKEEQTVEREQICNRLRGALQTDQQMTDATPLVASED